MSLRLFLSHLKGSRWGIVAWAFFLFLMGLFVIYLYPSIKTAGLGSYYESLPEELKIMMGAGDMPSAQGFFPLESFLTMEFLSWWPVAIVIYAIFAAGGIVAREVERGTMDLILSHPLRRIHLVVSKFAVFLAGVAAIALASLLGVALGLTLIEDRLDLGGVALALAQGGFLVLAVGSYSLLFSCLFLDPRKTLLASGVVTASLYILNFMAPSLGPLDWVDRLSLFHYYKAGQIVQSGALDLTGLAVFGGVAAACFVASLIVFNRRDIAA